MDTLDSSTDNFQQSVLAPLDMLAEREGVFGLRATIDRAPVGIAHFDRTGKFLLVNQRLCEILGYSSEYLLGCTFQQLTFADDLPECVRLSTELGAGRIPSYSQEKRFVRSNGNPVWVRVTVSAVRQTDGELAFFIGVAEEITAQRAAEAAEREARERLRAALSASDTGTFRWDIRTNTLDWDENVDRLLGLAPGGAKRSLQQFIDCIHPEDRQRVVEACWLCAADGVDFDQEFRVIWPDGSLRWLRDKGRTFVAPDGEPVYLTGACVDVTARHIMEDELREQEERFRTLANAIPQMAWIADNEGLRSWYNDRWYSYSGMKLDELQGYGWQRAHHPEHLARVVEGQQAAFRRGEVWEDTFPLRRHDGEYRWFLSRAMPIRDAGGRIVKWFGTNTDITERKRTEEELQELVLRERDARSEAERATQLRDELMAIVAHDLRNPVQAITMSASIALQPKQTTDQIGRQLGVIHRSSRTMDRLISDLLDVSQLEAGHLVVNRNAVSIRALIDEVLEVFAQQASAKGLELHSQVAPGLPVISGDRHRITQVLSNLLGNAIKFTAAGSVTIRAEADDQALRISVTDTGHGIAADALPHVFDRFWQADRGTRAGVGLGLVIAKGIVEAHGGRIWISSAPESGTTVSFTLPRTD